MSDTSKQYDFKKICRICLKYRNNIISITSYNILNMIRACASIKISESDKLPQHICLTCFINLKNAFSLKQLCEKSDKELRKQIVEINDLNFKEIVIDNEKNNGTDTEYNIEEIHDNDDDEIKNDTDDDIDEDEQDSEEEEDANCDEDVEDEEDGDEPMTDSHEIKKDIEIKIIRTENLNSVRTNPVVPYKLTRYKYVCDECPCRFEYTHQLGKHMRRNHLVQALKCDGCPKVFYHALHLRDHSLKHVNLRLECDMCPRTYRNQKALDAHKLIHAGKLPFSCTECDNVHFESKFKLQKHLFSVHKRGEAPCKLVTCNICGKEVQKSSLARHRETHSDIPKFICEACNKKFASKYSYQDHINVVHNKMFKLNFTCSICGKMFRKRFGLKRHMMTHTQEKPFTCDRCNNKFASKSSLKTHITRTHLDERKFSCSVCMQTFFDNTTAENHMRTHTGEKPFQCKICDKNFSFKSALITHTSKLHPK